MHGEDRPFKPDDAKPTGEGHQRSAQPNQQNAENTDPNLDPRLGPYNHGATQRPSDRNSSRSIVNISHSSVDRNLRPLPNFQNHVQTPDGVMPFGPPNHIPFLQPPQDGQWIDVDGQREQVLAQGPVHFGIIDGESTTSQLQLPRRYTAPVAMPQPNAQSAMPASGPMTDPTSNSSWQVMNSPFQFPDYSDLTQYFFNEQHNETTVSPQDLQLNHPDTVLDDGIGDFDHRGNGSHRPYYGGLPIDPSNTYASPPPALTEYEGHFRLVEQYSMSNDQNEQHGLSMPYEEFAPDDTPQRLMGNDSSRAQRPVRSAATRSTPCTEANCKRGVKLTPTNSRFCSRHLTKWERNNAGPPAFSFPSGIWSFDDAKRDVYPRLPPAKIEDDDVDLSENFANDTVRRFVDAASTPYVNGSAYHIFHERQQQVFNGKFFKNDEVNKRMRFLYQAVLVFHIGGETVYPEGGDNGGYGKADKSMKFSERLDKIIELLKLDKRVCMDVVEGRGVTALVATPDKYEKRKTQNKDSNAKKQKKQRLGDEYEAKMKARGKDVDGSDVDSDDGDDESDEDGDREEDVAAAPPMDTPASLLLDDFSAPPKGRKRKQPARSATPVAARTKRAKKLKTTANNPGTYPPPEVPHQDQSLAPRIFESSTDTAEHLRGGGDAVSESYNDLPASDDQEDWHAVFDELERYGTSHIDDAWS
ncbi:hypothetical protein LTR37_012458 [Vermiconidia calcicola]|uniref:Uncharacterized protein n=1 Tax=Vermiconidia calcicola TaxID=1690605 RepID=A0ACC3MZG6_9PEZI|nr:hypothetical protein LTR37_012458 [Vermiconidia calcicola]